MASRTQRKKQLLQILGLLLAVTLMVVGSIVFQNWWSKRSEREPQDVTVTVQSGDTTLELQPYSICEPGSQCQEGEVPSIEVDADAELNLTIPDEVSDHDWSLLKIYNDPSQNDQTFYGAHEATQATAPARSGKADLVVVEVSSVLISHDANGEESPVTVTWSVEAHVRKP